MVNARREERKEERREKLSVSRTHFCVCSDRVCVCTGILMHRHLYVIISAQCIRDNFLNFGVLEKFMKLFFSALYTGMST